MSVQFKWFLALILLAYVGGCAHTFVPTERDPFEPGAITTEFTSKNAVSLQNNQPTSEAVTFFRSGMHYYLADRQECTQVASAIMKREITKRGMQVVENNPRSVKLSVISLNTNMGYWSYDIVVHITATTGDGYTNDYEGGGNGYMGGPHKAADVALSDAVAKVLSDPKIVAYLTK
jgi:hypothetical protein